MHYRYYDNLIQIHQIVHNIWSNIQMSYSCIFFRKSLIPNTTIWKFLQPVYRFHNRLKSMFSCIRTKLVVHILDNNA